MSILEKIIYKIHMYFKEKAYERAKLNERLHGRVIKKQCNRLINEDISL